jgi:hypothetical protein
MSSIAKLSFAALVMAGLAGASLTQIEANTLAEVEATQIKTTTTTKTTTTACVKPAQPVGKNTWD